ncbi:MAG: diguanylate cyclase [Peptococcaceae bacterium]|jgi:diguanylate cyclase (GGDEF)-like protein|nr:diguanylate cyclase [Peptococcaceae bacterium]MDH7526334.1 diguanylate cyclase [Peptococcaceae bacterium]
MSENSIDFTKGIRDMSILYELSLSIGRSLDLVENCDNFLKTLMARFNLGFVSLWIKNKHLPGEKDDGFATLVYAVPDCYTKERKTMSLENFLFKNVNKKGYLILNNKQNAVIRTAKHREVESGSCIVFALGDLGILKLYSKREDYGFDDIFINQLRNVLEKFVISIEGSLAYKKLHLEMCERERAEEELRTARDELERKVLERTWDLERANRELQQEITERRQLEEKLKFLSLHDSLTGLHNRTFFQQKIKQINQKEERIGIFVCDVDGLKLINDSLGHDSGDKLLRAAARVLKGAFRENGVIARIGGDEFAVLLKNVTDAQMEEGYRRIREGIVKHNEARSGLPLSVSVGFAVRDDSATSITDLYREADNNMYREKLHRRLSNRNTIVQALMSALEARDFITEGYTERVEKLALDMASAIGLSEKNISDLRLLARFHDIGKVGIPDSILLKKSPLTPNEIKKMQRHSEIGYRIAQSSPDLAAIADWILKHHEWWNGGGYPLGLKGMEIPLECRILAIVDAYEAMTSDRLYRKAMSHEEAVNELKRCAGTQFDPFLVERFIRIFSQEEVKNA